MYERFYGLSERPFDMTPNPRYLLLTPTHTEALNSLEYGLTKRSITLLLGDAGTGKTTVVRKALATWQSRDVRVHTVHLLNPALTRAEFLETLADQFGLPEAAAASKTRVLHGVECVLRERRERGELTVMVVDEAQSLSDELLEEIRLLTNIESDTEKQLPLILAGQPELAARLNAPSLRPLKQRIGLRHTLAPLTLRETSAYIAGRVRLAGGEPASLFSREAVEAIYENSHGIPRTIGVIADNALLAGFASACRPVLARFIADVCRDFDLQ